MAPVDMAYYDLLQVKPDANEKELKTAYKKASLRMHPDKGGDPEQFKSMKAAYDVLNDPKRREIYDKYGIEVMKMMEGNVGSPMEVWKAISRVGKRERGVALLVIVSLAGAILSPAILLALRWDRIMHCHWSIVFIPLWLVQACGLCFLIACIQEPEQEHEPEDEDARAMHNERKLRMRLIRLCASMVLSLLITVELFVAMKLEGEVDWSWFVVLLPWAALEIFLLGWICTGAQAAWAHSDPMAAAAAASTGGSAGSSGKFWSFLAKKCWWGVLRLATYAVVSARADRMFILSWFYCLIPLFVGAAGVVLAACFKPKRPAAGGPEAEARRAQGLEEGAEDDGAAESGGEDGVCAACCSVCTWLIMACAAAGKLDGHAYSAFFIFLPVFLSVGCISCCFACVVIRLSPEVVDSVQEAVEQEERDRLNKEQEKPSYGSAS